VQSRHHEDGHQLHRPLAHHRQGGAQHQEGHGGDPVSRALPRLQQVQPDGEEQPSLHFRRLGGSRVRQEPRQGNNPTSINPRRCLFPFQELIPLIFGFEPPIMAQNIDNTCPYVIKIQEQYKVQVMFKTRSKLHATIVLVKGVEWEVEQVKQATILLMEFMCDNLAVTDWRVFERFT
jgi:hypothetical protein